MKLNACSKNIYIKKGKEKKSRKEREREKESFASVLPRDKQWSWFFKTICSKQIRQRALYLRPFITIPGLIDSASDPDGSIMLQPFPPLDRPKSQGCTRGEKKGEGGGGGRGQKPFQSTTWQRTNFTWGARKGKKRERNVDCIDSTTLQKGNTSRLNCKRIDK